MKYSPYPDHYQQFSISWFFKLSSRLDILRSFLLEPLHTVLLINIFRRKNVLLCIHRNPAGPGDQSPRRAIRASTTQRRTRVRHKRRTHRKHKRRKRRRHKRRQWRRHKRRTRGRRRRGRRRRRRKAPCSARFTEAFRPATAIYSEQPPIADSSEQTRTNS